MAANLNLKLSPSKKFEFQLLPLYICLSVYLVVLLETLHEKHGGYSTIKFLDKKYAWKCFRA